MLQSTANANVLTGFAELVRGAGADPTLLMRRARIPRAALLDPEARVPVDRLARLLDMAVETTGWMDFGLRLARARRLSHFGAIGLLARDEPDVGHALRALISYMHLHSQSVALQLDEHGEEAAMSARLLSHRVAWAAASSVQVNDLLVGGLFQVLRRLLGEAWRPTRVALAHAPPADARAWRQYFGAPVLFDQDHNTIFFRVRDLAHELPEADPLWRNNLQHQLDERASLEPRRIDWQVRELIQVMLPAGRCSMERVALRLGLQPRTLHRHLRATNVTFIELLDASRAELAQRYVVESSRPLADIAKLLGFSQTSAFSRWFSREFGQTATAMRASGARSG